MGQYGKKFSNPEIYPWKTEIDSKIRGFDKGKNPTGSIYN